MTPILKLAALPTAADLINNDMDLAIAQHEGHTVLSANPVRIARNVSTSFFSPRVYSPSTDWRDAGPLIAREWAVVRYVMGGVVTADDLLPTICRALLVHWGLAR